jgi:putative ABC transport system permease protein
MLQITNICKTYRTGSLVQKALDDVSLNLRENEFVAILGPSGSGKTTLLNIIGGLDRYDSGDLIINGISTRKYRDRDWDSYRNHTIGFVFQSYNLIPHQTILANVELALTISGVSHSERRERAAQALERVGLGEQLHKKPSQLSGGQMQRVAIARALVNDPDVLLADEPTGALDSETSVQVMELLKEVARDRLVVMVTHNPELAEAYATRIVHLKDGRIRSDSHPFQPDSGPHGEPVHKKMGKASMSFLTALSLSFNNLRTKKARTLLTSFAGSIGIIGIALILSLSNGVNAYIKSVEEDTLSEYPIELQSTEMDFASMMAGMGSTTEAEGDGQVTILELITNMFSTVDANDLASFKTYLDSGESGIEPYASAIEYVYGVAPQIYRTGEDGSVRQVHPDKSFSALGLGSTTSSSSLMSSMMSTDVFSEMPEDTELFMDQYEVKAGHWPEAWNECVLVLSSGGSISDFMLYTMGLRDALELDEMVEEFLAEEPVEVPDDIRSYDYEEFLGIDFRLVNSSDYYVYDEEYGIWRDKTEDEEYMKDLVENGETLTIVGVVQQAPGAAAGMLDVGINYPASLTRHVMDAAAGSPVVQEQLENPGTNVLTGTPFGESSGDSLDLESLFSIDEEALRNAFRFDEESLSMEIDPESLGLDAGSLGSGSVDLSFLTDPDSMSLETPELSGLDMDSLLSRLDLSLSVEGLQSLTGSLLEGYQEYASSHPEADYSHLGETFMEYLQTDAARQTLADCLENILQDTETSVSPESLEQLIRDVMAGFQEYALANGMTDPDRFSEYLAAYLETPEAQQLIAEGASQVIQITGEPDLSPEQLQACAEALLDGYQEYAVAGGLPDPSKMGEHFSAYLQTPEGQQRLTEGLQETINMEVLQQQIGSALEEYMTAAVGTYSSAMARILESQIASLTEQLLSQITRSMTSAMEEAMGRMSSGLEDAFSVDQDAFASAITVKMDQEELTELLVSLMSAEDTSYDGVLQSLGYADPDDPDAINIYPTDFESKGRITDILDAYNSLMEAQGRENQVIKYTDMVGTLMSSVTDIVNVISYVLVAFVAISLVVSSIMIGVITYISVLERRKEIGILRAIGASRRNVGQVFNAETVIIGFCAGAMGIVLTLILLIPANFLIHSVAGQPGISASLPVVPALVLILLSILLTLTGGLIPSRKAAKSDPVTALRSE